MRLEPGHYYDVVLPDGNSERVGAIAAKGDGWWEVGAWQGYYEPRPGVCKVRPLGYKHSLNLSQLVSVREFTPDEMMATFKSLGGKVPTE